MERKDREFGFNVVDVECFKCSGRAAGRLYVEKETLSYSGSDGFIVYPDGIICARCMGEKRRVKVGRRI